MDFSTLITDLKERIAVSDSSSFWSSTSLKRWINQANKWTATQKPWRILLTSRYTTTVANQNYYDLPSNYLYGTVFFVKVDNKDYNYVSETTFRDENFSTDYTFTIHGKFFFLYPTPTEDGLVIDLYFQKRPATLTEDTDTPELQEELHEAIVQRALYVALKRAGKDREAQEALIDAKDIIRETWEMDKKAFKGPKTLKSILSNFPNYSNSGLN